MLTFQSHQEDLTFIFAGRLEEVLNAAFEGGFDNLLPGSTRGALDSKL